MSVSCFNSGPDALTHSIACTTEADTYIYYQNYPKITDEMVVTENRIPELHFSRWKKVTFYGQFLSYTLAFFPSFVSYIILHCMEKLTSFPSWAKTFQSKNLLFCLCRWKKNFQWCRKTGQTCKHLVETRVQKSACIKEKIFYFFTYLHFCAVLAKIRSGLWKRCGPVEQEQTLTGRHHISLWWMWGEGIPLLHCKQGIK